MSDSSSDSDSDSSTDSSDSDNEGKTKTNVNVSAWSSLAKQNAPVNAKPNDTEVLERYEDFIKSLKIIFFINKTANKIFLSRNWLKKRKPTTQYLKEQRCATLLYQSQPMAIMFKQLRL